MGGFFGVVSKRDCIIDVFFGVDYHSHLGTSRAGMASYCEEDGFQRHIHNIENTPFRTKFEGDLDKMKGKICIGCISDTGPQPLLIYSHNGIYAISIVGVINNKEELAQELLLSGKVHFGAMGGGNINSTELVATLIDQKKDFAEGIAYAQSRIKGSLSILIMTANDGLIVARDAMGRIPVVIGKDEDGHCVSFESFAFRKLGYSTERELGPGEIVRLTADSEQVLRAPQNQMKICSFLWTYYGYPNSTYEGINVEVMRNKNGEIMARDEIKNGTYQDVDFVCGVPDSGIPHAMGYANYSKKTFARPFIKYTPTWPRSFMPKNQKIRNQVAKMKLIPVEELIKDKKLLFVDDSIVRGTQLRETVDFLYDNGAEEVHMRSACPPIMYGCKYLNFSSSKSEMDLLARRIIVELEGEEGFNYIDEYADGTTERGRNMRRLICEKLGFKSLEFQSLDGMIEAIGLPADCVCTYCWNGKE
ncbi:MAG: amidophosphoribosyltransferase [Ruminococcus sp.]|nr:amidophosphoribosyltransferase [Ruminococcus sp.]